MPELRRWGESFIPGDSIEKWHAFCDSEQYSVETIVASAAILRLLDVNAMRRALVVLIHCKEHFVGFEPYVQHSYCMDISGLSDKCMSLMQKYYGIVPAYDELGNPRFILESLREEWEALHDFSSGERQTDPTIYPSIAKEYNNTEFLPSAEIIKIGINYFNFDPPDDFRAAVHFLYAGCLGNIDGIFNTGYCFENGFGFTRNLEEAKCWYLSGAQMGGDLCKQRYENIVALEQEERERQQNWERENLQNQKSFNPVTPPPTLSSLQELLDELNSMIGLQSVKDEINKRVSVMIVQQAAREAGVQRKNLDMSLHLAFEGNPGTGKTTVARLIGKIYHALGILKTDNFIECSREDLVGEYVGHTGQKTREKINEALDGVLFIDEAYALYREGVPNDFGKDAIDALTKAMEDYRDRLVIIIAGYTEEIKNLLRKGNKGFVSRFKTEIVFEDYTLDEMVQILYKLGKEAGVTFEDGTDEMIRNLIAMRSQMPDFGNGRGVRKILEGLYETRDLRLAQALSNHVQLSAMDFVMITAQDIQSYSYQREIFTNI